jgi:hypothetical protein
VIFASPSVANDVETASGHIILLISLLRFSRIIVNIQGRRCRVNESPPAEELWDDRPARRRLSMHLFLRHGSSSFPG